MKIRIVGAAVALVLAVVGTLLITSYVRAADARALEGTETRDIYVVDTVVPAETPVEELSEHLRVQAVPAAVVADGAVADLGPLSGRMTAVQLQPGEQLLETRLVDPAAVQALGTVAVPEGMQEVTVQLDAGRVVGGRLQAGDTVGVFTSFSEGADGKPVTRLLFHKVLVTSIQGAPVPAADDAESAEAGAGPAVPEGAMLVTLAQTAADAEKTVYASEFGTLWLSKEPTDAKENNGGVTMERLFP